MRVLTCSVPATPCPPESQAWVSLAELLDPVLLGITPQSVLFVLAWGVGAVLLLWSIGYAVGAGVTVIRKA